MSASYIPPSSSSSIIDRMRRAAMLDASLYEEVEHDSSATGQAAVVVALSAVASAIGLAFRGGPGLISGVVGTVVGWAVWSGITFLIGTRLFNGRATWSEVLRTLGFAQAPGVLMALAIIPILGRPIAFIVGLWVAVAGFVALRQALDIDAMKTFFTVLIGMVALVLVRGLIGGLVGIPIY
jgi:hypothetical protein